MAAQGSCIVLRHLLLAVRQLLQPQPCVVRRRWSCHHTNQRVTPSTILWLSSSSPSCSSSSCPTSNSGPLPQVEALTDALHLPHSRRSITRYRPWATIYLRGAGHRAAEAILERTFRIFSAASEKNSVQIINPDSLQRVDQRICSPFIHRLERWM